MNDPRLARWLELTRQLLARAPAERLALFDELLAERAELTQSLRIEPPTGDVAPELVLALERTESELASALAELRTDLGQRIDVLRHARHAASGYQPTALSAPAFVSRSV